MPSTVSACFNKFRSDYVDLPTETTATARASRDFLYDQIKTLGKTTLLTGATQSFGSFARRTKMRPIDDIDCLAMLECNGTTLQYLSSYTYNLAAASTSWLYKYVDSSGYVNSTLVLNAVKKELESIAQYRQSTIGRNGSAVVLDLKSYAWSFDVVPACPVNDSAGVTSYYVIPNGAAKWMKTDPRFDAKRTTDASAKHGGHFLPAIRLLKYWNRRTHKPRLGSYHFETIVTNRALSHSSYATLQNALEDLLYGIRSNVMSSCSDPKGYGPNLDAGVSPDTKQKVYSAADSAWSAARRALTAEINGDQKAAIAEWRTIFGSDFPVYD